MKQPGTRRLGRTYIVRITSGPSEEKGSDVKPLAAQRSGTRPLLLAQKESQ